MQASEPILQTKNLNVYYGTKRVVTDVTLDFARNRITAIIGPSGCGKSTLLRCFNRMNDLIPSATITGQVLFEGQDLYAPNVDPTEIRYQIGMVFQNPNPFPKSILDNVAFGPKINGFRGDMPELVERSLRRAALWEEVKDRLKTSALTVGFASWLALRSRWERTARWESSSSTFRSTRGRLFGSSAISVPSCEARRSWRWTMPGRIA